MQFNKFQLTTALKAAVVLTTLGANLTSCTDENRDLSVDKSEEYARKFIKEFGVYDMQHDWNAATRYRLSLSPQAGREASTITLYTSQPGTDGCRMVAQYPASQQSLTFDMPKTSEYVYYEFADTNGHIVSSGYHSLRNETLSTGRASRSTDECTATIGDGIKPGNVVSASPWNWHWNYQDMDFSEQIAFWKKLIGEEEYATREQLNQPIKATEVFKTYTIDGKKTEAGRPQDIEYMVNLFSEKTGTFAERVCNVTKFREKLHPERGVAYVMEEDGPVTITYFFGATQSHNKLGYLYYKEGATDEEIMHAPRFIIIDDARPQENIFGGVAPTDAGTNKFSDGMAPASAISNFEHGYLDSKFRYITGTKHHLVYFGDETEFSKGDPGKYTFPAGTHIVFFVIKGVGDKEDVPWKRSYSLPRLNWIMNYLTRHNENCKKTSQNINQLNLMSISSHINGMAIP